jgi:tetratricopeptide (TPR) repeat protein
MLGGRRRVLRRALALRQRGYELSKAGAYDNAYRVLGKAVRLYRQALDSGHTEVFTGRVGQTPIQADIGWEIGVALWRLANVTSALGKYGEAVLHGTEAADFMSADLERRDTGYPLGAGRRFGLAVCLTDLSAFACADGSPETAVDHATRAVNLLTDKNGNPWSPEDEKQLATAHHLVAAAHLDAGSHREADVAVRSALAIRVRQAGESAAPSLAHFELANSFLLQCRISAALGKRKAAVAALDRATDLANGLGPGGTPLLSQAAALRKTL